MAPSPEGCPPRPRLPQPLASVGQVPQEPPRYSIPHSRLGEELLGQGDVGDVGGGEFVGERNPIGATDELQLHPVDAERSPPNPCGAYKARRLVDLARMKDTKQRRVDEQGLWLSHQFAEHRTPYR